MNRSLQRVQTHFPHFNATMHHIPGRENTFADAMSRQKRLDNTDFLQKATAHVHRLVMGFPQEGGPYNCENECNDKDFGKYLCHIETPSYAAPNPTRVTKVMPIDAPQLHRTGIARSIGLDQHRLC